MTGIDLCMDCGDPADHGLFCPRHRAEYDGLPFPPAVCPPLGGVADAPSVHCPPLGTDGDFLSDPACEPAGWPSFERPDVND